MNPWDDVKKARHAFNYRQGGKSAYAALAAAYGERTRNITPVGVGSDPAYAEQIASGEVDKALRDAHVRALPGRDDPYAPFHDWVREYYNAQIRWTHLNQTLNNSGASIENAARYDSFNAYPHDPNTIPTHHRESALTNAITNLEKAHTDMDTSYSLVKGHISEDRKAAGFVHSNQKSLREWSYGAKLTVLHLPVDGVCWHASSTKNPGGSHSTPGMVMRAVRAGNDMFFAVGAGLDAPTEVTFRIPMLALLGFLAKAQSLDQDTPEGASGLRNQEHVTVIFNVRGEMLGKWSPTTGRGPAPPSALDE